MKKLYFIPLLLLIIFIAVLFLMKGSPKKDNLVVLKSNQVATPTGTPAVKNLSDNKSINNFQSPLDRASERVTKKKFGIYITPQNSPIQPERFKGFHTGTDFEIFPEESNSEVPVHAICSGNLLFKKYADGYGGVAVQECKLNGELITIIYGHLKLSSITAIVGKNINKGDIIGILGADKSVETDGERKHLHLGIHKGGAINILGYVGSKSELSNWIDVCTLIPKGC